MRSRHRAKAALASLVAATFAIIGTLSIPSAQAEDSPIPAPAEAQETPAGTETPNKEKVVDSTDNNQAVEEKEKPASSPTASKLSEAAQNPPADNTVTDKTPKKSQKVEFTWEYDGTKYYDPALKGQKEKILFVLELEATNTQTGQKQQLRLGQVKDITIGEDLSFDINDDLIPNRGVKYTDVRFNPNSDCGTFYYGDASSNLPIDTTRIIAMGSACNLRVIESPEIIDDTPAWSVLLQQNANTDFQFKLADGSTILPSHEGNIDIKVNLNRTENGKTTPHMNRNGKPVSETYLFENNKTVYPIYTPARSSFNRALSGNNLQLYSALGRYQKFALAAEIKAKDGSKVTTEELQKDYHAEVVGDDTHGWTITLSAKDTDKDGVPNHSDKCADTPTGAKVDENGCSVAPTLGKAPTIAGVVGKAINDVTIDVTNNGKATDLVCSAEGLPKGLNIKLNDEGTACVISGTPETDTTKDQKVTIKVDYNKPDGDKAAGTTVTQDTTANITLPAWNINPDNIIKTATPQAPKFVTPAAMDPADCQTNPWVEVFPAEGISYTVSFLDKNGNQIATNTSDKGKFQYEYGQTAKVVATAKGGYTLAENAVAKWEWKAEINPDACKKPNTPSKPDNAGKPGKATKPVSKTGKQLPQTGSETTGLALLALTLTGIGAATIATRRKQH